MEESVSQSGSQTTTHRSYGARKYISHTVPLGSLTVLGGRKEGVAGGLGGLEGVIGEDQGKEWVEEL